MDTSILQLYCLRGSFLLRALSMCVFWAILWADSATWMVSDICLIRWLLFVSCVVSAEQTYIRVDIFLIYTIPLSYPLSDYLIMHPSLSDLHLIYHLTH